MRPFYQLLFDYRTDRAFITPEHDLHFITGIVIKIFVIIMMMTTEVQTCSTYHITGTGLSILTNLIQTPYLESGISNESDCFILECVGRD